MLRQPSIKRHYYRYLPPRNRCRLHSAGGSKTLLNYETIVWVIRHDPMPVLGFTLMGASAVLSFHLHRKLQAAGERNLNQLITIPNTALWTLPRAYLKARSRHGWSAWPAYAVWACVVSGLMLLVAGLARLGH
jgi:hypothetical protein